MQSSVGVVSGLLGDAVAFRNGLMSDSSRERFSQLIFYALIILIGYLTYLVMSPFLAPLAWAAVFAVMFYPVHQELSPTAVLIVAPAVMLVSVIAREAPQVIDYLKQMSNTAPEQIDRIWEVVRRRSPTPLPEDPTFLVREGAQRVLV